MKKPTPSKALSVIPAMPPAIAHALMHRKPEPAPVAEVAPSKAQDDVARCRARMASYTKEEREALTERALALLDWLQTPTTKEAAQ